MSHEIVARLLALKLHGMAANWPELVAHCRHAALDHEQLVEQLLNQPGTDQRPELNGTKHSRVALRGGSVLNDLDGGAV